MKNYIAKTSRPQDQSKLNCRIGKIRSSTGAFKQAKTDKEEDLNYRYKTSYEDNFGSLRYK